MTVTDAPSKVPLRPPEMVMKLERMGAAYPTRLSFMRILLRKLKAENSKVDRTVWEIDKTGYGRAVYSVVMDGNTYSLVAFSTALKPEQRTDRVIAEAWDASFVLFDGIPSKQDLNRLEVSVPKQEGGRFSANELTLSRANKSVRFFEHVVDNLSQGEQPDAKMIGEIGYLMRTTAVYGNGKFGFADRVKFCERSELSGPFQAEMLTVWLIRGFTHDLVDHIARLRNPKSCVELSQETKRNLGVGNSTGLGMAPFLIKHALLLNNWVKVRETALARVRAIVDSDKETINTMRKLIARARQHVDQWNVADERQMGRINILRSELKEVETLASCQWLENAHPWNRLIEASSKWSIECQELIAAMLLEPHGALVDDLATQMTDNIGLHLDPSMAVGEVTQLLKSHYQSALDIDFSQQKASALFWYTSAQKLEPRLGIRGEEPGDEWEMPIDIARQACLLFNDLKGINGKQSVALFLLNYPQHRYIIMRVQSSKNHCYSEIRDNLIDGDCKPLDILRFKLSFFGAGKCDPKSNLWTRINMYQGAPLFDDIEDNDCDNWWLPVLEQPS